MSWSWVSKPARAFHHEYHDVCFSHGLACLFRHFFENTATGIRLKTAGINDDKFMFTVLAVAVVTVTRQARKIGNDGITCFCQPIESVDLPTLGRPTRAITGFM